MLIHMLLCYVFRWSRGIRWRMSMRNGGMKLPDIARVSSPSMCFHLLSVFKPFRVSRRFKCFACFKVCLDIWIALCFGMLIYRRQIGVSGVEMRFTGR